jgi:predicted secreted protein
MNKRGHDVLFLISTFLILVFAVPSMGQVLKGSISGTVVDPQDAVISGAQAKAVNTSTGTVVTTTSDGAGLFRFNLIPAGTYNVEISAQGFQTSVQNNILVAAGADSGLGARLIDDARGEVVGLA